MGSWKYKNAFQEPCFFFFFFISHFRPHDSWNCCFTSTTVLLRRLINFKWFVKLQNYFQWRTTQQQTFSTVPTQAFYFFGTMFVLKPRCRLKQCSDFTIAMLWENLHGQKFWIFSFLNLWKFLTKILNGNYKNLRFGQKFLPKLDFVKKSWIGRSAAIRENL